jgi:CheY-like chemotaxis protein
MPHKQKILYFEDDPFMAAMYKTKLELEGFDVRHFEHPDENVAEVAAMEQPDLIFMDTIMPVMDGFRATEILQADERTRGIPIFGMSNLGQPKDIQLALSLGMWDYWVSALHMPGEVVEKIRSILSGEPQKPRPPKPEPEDLGKRPAPPLQRGFPIRRWLLATFLALIGMLLLAVAIFGTR